jgi:hypothetical protein
MAKIVVNVAFTVDTDILGIAPEAVTPAVAQAELDRMVRMAGLEYAVRAQVTVINRDPSAPAWGTTGRVLVPVVPAKRRRWFSKAAK